MIMYWVRGEIESLMVGENWIKIVIKGKCLCMMYIRNIRYI